MSLIENAVVQPSIHDGRVSRRLPCNRCPAVIEYDQGTEWSLISELASEHWHACPGKAHARTARMPARIPTSPTDTAIVSSPPSTAPAPGSTLRLRTGPEPVRLPHPHPNASHTWISSGCERKRRTLEQRKLALEQDEYAKNVTNKSVVCAGCHKEISLDKRSDYYPGLWVKHKGKCPGIEKLESANTTLKTTEVPGEDVVPIPLPGGKGCGDGALRLAAAPTLRLVRQHDSEVTSSDDSDEDTGETFPTLNSDYYLTERNYNPDAEWTYRYATKHEITTNLFRGQDEPYTCLGSRQGQGLGAHLGPQKGGQAVPRCVIQNRVELEAFSPSRPEHSLRSMQELSEVDRRTACTVSAR